jgi:hypothetical protein
MTESNFLDSAPVGAITGLRDPVTNVPLLVRRTIIGWEAIPVIRLPARVDDEALQGAFEAAILAGATDLLALPVPDQPRKFRGSFYAELGFSVGALRAHDGWALHVRPGVVTREALFSSFGVAIDPDPE